MKKDKIVLIRVLTVAAVLAALALVLVFGAGGGLFHNIVNDINNNQVPLDSAGASIYNLYFYKGLGVPYLVLFSAALFAAAAASVGILTRFWGAAVLAKAAAVSGMVTGAYIVLAVLFEKNVLLHRLIDRFYIGEVQGTIETVRLIGVVPLVSGIVLIVLGGLCLALLPASGITKMKIYQSAEKMRDYVILLPVLYGCVFCEILREILIGSRCEALGAEDLHAYTYIQDYYFADAWGFDIPYVWFLLAAAVVLIALRGMAANWMRDKKISLLPVFTAVVFGVLLGIRSIIFWMNPPRLFGYLTLDEAVCDVTEAAYPLYMLIFVLDICLLAVWLAQLLLCRSEMKKIALLCAAHCIASIAAILAGQLAGIVGIYAACAVVNIVTIAGSCILCHKMKVSKAPVSQQA